MDILMNTVSLSQSKSMLFIVIKFQMGTGMLDLWFIISKWWYEMASGRRML